MKLPRCGLPRRAPAVALAPFRSFVAGAWTAPAVRSRAAPFQPQHGLRHGLQPTGDRVQASPGALRAAGAGADHFAVQAQPCLADRNHARNRQGIPRRGGFKQKSGDFGAGHPIRIEHFQGRSGKQCKKRCDVPRCTLPSTPRRNFPTRFGPAIANAGEWERGAAGLGRAAGNIACCRPGSGPSARMWRPFAPAPGCFPASPPKLRRCRLRRATPAGGPGRTT